VRQLGLLDLIANLVDRKLIISNPNEASLGDVLHAGVRLTPGRFGVGGPMGTDDGIDDSISVSSVCAITPRVTYPA
jgi:hypothetical protein